jgi:hypothetical protein
VVWEHIVILLVDPIPNLVFAPLLTIEFKILALSWAIYDVPVHLISNPAWERSVVLKSNSGNMDFSFCF